MVPVTAPSDDSGLAVAYEGSWLAAAAQRIATADVPGSLDSLLARYFVGGTTVPGLAPDASRLSAQWLEENRDRLGQAPVIATIGYGLAGASPGTLGPARAALATSLPKLMARSPFADRITFIRDPLQVIGIGLAAQAMTPDLPAFTEWLAEVLQDERLQPPGRFQALLYQHVRALLTGRTESAEIQPDDDVTVLALRYWMISTGTARPPDPGEHHAFQQRIVSEALRTEPSQLSIPRTAVIYRAVTTILDSSIDHAILSRHLVAVLGRFEAAMRRWRYDKDSARQPVKWPVNSEREVQDILWLILRSVFDDVVDEETLPKAGHSTYRADFGIPSLGVLIEVKYARRRSDFKEKIEPEVMVDSVAYLHGTTAYKEIVVFIYDASASVQEHDTTSAFLRGLDSVSDVVIVSRPSQLDITSTSR